MNGKRFRLGVTAGKFNPPHRGHAHLLEVAASRCDQVLVLVCDHPIQTIPAGRRRDWLAATSPANCVFVVTPDDLPADDSTAWARRAEDVARGLNLGAIEAAFTSEAYGTAWAAAIGATHVAVDPARVTVPVRGTDLRADLRGGFSDLVPAARAALSRRVVLVGAESTGKTTLARELASVLGTVWVPEWARTYDDGKRTSTDAGWTSDEFVTIAQEQAHLEDRLALRANGLVICDTDALATSVWRRRYLGTDDPVLLGLAAERRPDLYLLSDLDLPWSDDGTRESGDRRASMHQDFLSKLETSGVDWRLVTGRGPARTDAALTAIEPLVSRPVLA